MEQFIATIGVFLGELYGNFVGGGSIVTQFVLQGILDMDIKKAMVLDNFAAYGSVLGMLFIFLKKRYKIDTKKFLIFTTSQLLGSLLGAYFLVVAPQVVVKILFVISILLVVFYNILGEKFSFLYKIKDNITFFVISALFIGAYNGLLVIGDWIIALLLLTSFLGFSYKKAVFMLTLSSLFASPASLFTYYKAGLIDFSYAVPMTVATIVGGLISASIIDKLDSDFMKRVLKILGFLLAIYLVVSLINN